MGFCKQMTSILVWSPSKFVGDAQIAERWALSLDFNRGEKARIHKEVSHRQEK